MLHKIGDRVALRHEGTYHTGTIVGACGIEYGGEWMVREDGRHPVAAKVFACFDWELQWLLEVAPTMSNP